MGNYEEGNNYYFMLHIFSVEAEKPKTEEFLKSQTV